MRSDPSWQALREQLAAVAASWSAAGDVREAVVACGGAGLLRPPVGWRDEGEGPSFDDTARALECLGFAVPRQGYLLGTVAHLCGCVLPLARAGSPEVRAEVLPDLIAGHGLGAFAASEPEAGSDVFALATRARADGDCVVLDGVKAWVINGPVADWIVVLARNDADAIDAHLVSRDDPGFAIERVVPTSGMRGAPMGHLRLAACRIPASRRIGARGAGEMVFHRAMAAERTMICAGFLGAMERVLVACIRHARERRQFGRAIGSFQSVANRIADMRIRLEAARALVASAVAILHHGSRSPLEPSMAKIFVSEAALAVYLDAVQIFGAAGYTDDLEYAEGLRDAVGLLTLSGPNDVHRQLVSRYLGVGS